MLKHFLMYPQGFGRFDLQFFAEGDAGDGRPGGGDNTPKFSGQFKEMTDPVSNQKVMVPVELETFFGHTISKTRDSIKKEFESKYQPMIDALQAEAGEGSKAKEELEKIRLEAMSAEERAQANAKKVIDEASKKEKAAMEEANKYKSLFEKSTIKTDIMSSFGDAKLCNPSQVAMLFEMEGQAVVSQKVNEEGKPLNEYETRVRLTLEDKNGNPEIVEGTPAELFKRWISLDRNAHHVLNTSASGSGARPGSNKMGGMKGEEFQKMNPVQRMQLAREQANGK